MKYSHVLIFCGLLLAAGFIGFSLRTPTVEAPQTTIDSYTPGTQGRDTDEILSVTEDTITSGATRDLSNTNLREVPRSEFDRRDTEILDLSGNQLVSLQAEVRQLTNLRVLDLSGNVLTNIPAELGQLSKLEVLNLSNNKLTGLPYELGNLSNLKTLDLRGNAYAKADLVIIKQKLPATTKVLVD